MNRLKVFIELDFELRPLSQIECQMLQMVVEDIGIFFELAGWTNIISSTPETQKASSQDGALNIYDENQAYAICASSF